MIRANYYSCARLVFAVAIVCTSFVATTVRADDTVASTHEAVAALLDAQSAAWNAGDIDAYLSYYLDGPETVHVIRGVPITGFDAIAAGYRERNPDPARYGAISYQDLRVTPLGDKQALAYAIWEWRLGDAKANGAFTLVLTMTDDGWKVMHDHTTLGSMEGM